MNYLFVLGREPELSLAELFSVLRREGVAFNLEHYQAGAAIVGAREKLDTDFLMAELGGTIKIAEAAEHQFSNAPLPAVKAAILEFLRALSKKSGRKLFFGLSGYGPWQKKDLEKIGLSVKNDLAQDGIVSRLVVSRDSALSSVVVKTNKLLSERGADLSLVLGKNSFWLGRTLAVQPFAEFSERDFGRPGRDPRSGMLPPKLAKIMLNLSEVKKTKTILDPFCGSGTVATEAGVMGWKKILASDINPRAVADTEKNWQWLTRAKPFSGSLLARQADVAKLSSVYGPETVAAIVTEPFLGPPLSKTESRKNAREILADLSKFYEKFLREAMKILTRDGVIVMVWPFFREGQEYFLPLTIERLAEIGMEIVPLLPKEMFAFLTARHTLLYSRPDQQVGREIVKLKK